MAIPDDECQMGGFTFALRAGVAGWSTLVMIAAYQRGLHIVRTILGYFSFSDLCCLWLVDGLNLIFLTQANSLHSLSRVQGTRA